MVLLECFMDVQHIQLLLNVLEHGTVMVRLYQNHNERDQKRESTIPSWYKK